MTTKIQTLGKMIDIEEHLQRSIGSEEVGMPTEKWVAVLEEMRQLRKENKALRERLAQPVHAIDISQERVDETGKSEHEPYNPMERNADYERGFIDGRADQMKSSVDRAVNRMAPREWVGLTPEEFLQAAEIAERGNYFLAITFAQQTLKEKNT